MTTSISPIAREGPMRLRVPKLRVLAAAWAISLAACGDSTSPARPASLSVVAGDLDSALAGEQIVLQVRVNGSDSRPYAGAVVTWTVQQGPSTLASPTSTSGSDGIASNSVTLGGRGVQTTIIATTGGATPAAFTVSTIDPCTVLWSLATGATTNGTLSSTDCLLGDGSLIDYYQFALTTQSGVAIAMNSASFDTWIIVFDGQGNPVGVDDDGGVGSNSLLRAILPSGTYILGANSYSAGQTGPYTVQVQQPGIELGDCEVAWATKGVAVPQQLTTASCPAPDGTVLAADHLLIVLDQGQSLTVNLTSAAFAARVVIYNGNGFFQTATNAAGAGATASVAFTAPANDVYIVQLGAVGGATGGAYQVTLQ
jgi:hypothetical protein